MIHNELLSLIYLIIPGVVANMTPVLVKKIPLLSEPISPKVFGSHKTYRGFFFGILGAIIIVWIQKRLYIQGFFTQWSLLNYGSYSPLLVGFLMGFGVLFGDLVKSYFKRKVGIPPGKRWFPFDQLDALGGGLIFLSVIYIPPIHNILELAVIVSILHVFLNHLGYWGGVKKTKW